MSNYLRTTKHPKTGNWETAHWLDAHFGQHQYGVKFEDGTIIAPDFQKGYPETRDDKPEKDWDWQERKEPELTAPVPPEGCTCASFWTVRGTHKKDCPLSTTEPPKTLIEILDNLTFEVIRWSYYASSAETRAEQLKAAQEIQALIEREVIGEDGVVTGYDRPNTAPSVDLTQSYYNALRAEQRLRLSKLIGGGDARS